MIYIEYLKIQFRNMCFLFPNFKYSHRFLRSNNFITTWEALCMYLWIISQQRNFYNRWQHLCQSPLCIVSSNAHHKEKVINDVSHQNNASNLNVVYYFAGTFNVCFLRCILHTFLHGLLGFEIHECEQRNILLDSI